MPTTNVLRFFDATDEASLCIVLDSTGVRIVPRGTEGVNSK